MNRSSNIYIQHSNNFFVYPTQDQLTKIKPIIINANTKSKNASLDYCALTKNIPIKHLLVIILPTSSISDSRTDLVTTDMKNIGL